MAKYPKVPSDKKNKWNLLSSSKFEKSYENKNRFARHRYKTFDYEKGILYYQNSRERITKTFKLKKKR
ncbi:structural protein [Cellulophaga phage phi48:2]|uniref:structural protein n=1 Tax=Cellulophaga phage phi48:2 TaxID=1327968 RepID=UPI000351C2A5|nr:structural protein [Cellulophaga phage phi48:2]AGO47268.1 structural protein [Cellulophaga phage phi48:2]